MSREVEFKRGDLVQLLSGRYAKFVCVAPESESTDGGLVLGGFALVEFEPGKPVTVTLSALKLVRSATLLRKFNLV